MEGDLMLKMSMEYIIGRVQELLKSFKSSENSNSVKFIANDPDAILVLSVWPALPILLNDPLTFGGPPQHRQNLWKYIWRFRRIDYKEIEKRTGLSDRKKLQEIVSLLSAHQLIYPDGSISQPAQAFLSSH